MADLITSQVEALLFISGKPMTFKALAKEVDEKVSNIKKIVQDLQTWYVDEKRGIGLVITDTSAQMFTAPELHELVEGYLQAQQHSELTRPQLETLAIIAYRGPIIKESLEQIRGVNCSMILRNLMIRGLIIEKETLDGIEYSTSEDFLGHLGIGSVDDLPDYNKLSQHDDFDMIENNTLTDDKTEKN